MARNNKGCEELFTECQKVARRPMKVLLLIIGKPFEQIAMDVVGPLQKTASGHQCILVISDYDTIFPEAYPLRRFMLYV